MKPEREPPHPALALAGFAALFVAMFAPVLIARAYAGDAVDQLLETLPAYLGAHPLWEPRMMLGYPLAADPNQAYFYPLALLRFVPSSFDWYEIAAYAIAATGAYGLVRATTRSTFGAIAGALVYACGGFLIGQAGHLTIVEPAAWIPFLFWSLTEMGVRARAAGWTLGCVAATALAILAGQPQPIVDALFFAVPYAVLVARRADDGARAYAVRACGALVLGAGCAAIALVPEAELFRNSARATFGFERFQEFTVPVLQLPIRAFFPYALGFTPLAPYRDSAFNVGSFAEMSNYAGIVTLVLAAVAVIAARRAPYVTYWIVAAVAALALATGNQLGLGWLTYHVPLYDLFRAPGRVALEFDLAIGVLAGAGIAAVEDGRADARAVRRACEAVAGAFAFAFVVLVDVASAPPVVQNVLVSGSADIDVSPLHNAATAIPLASLACGALAVVFWARAPRSAVHRAALGAVIVADLASFALFAYWRFGAFGTDRLTAPAYAASLRASLAPDHQRVLTVPQPGADSGGIAPNLNLLWDVASLRGYTPLQLARTRAFFDSDWDTPAAPLADPRDRTLDLGSVRYVVIVESGDLSQKDPALPFARDLDRFRLVRHDGTDEIFENRRALPRAWVVAATAPAPDPARTLDAMHAAAFDPRALAYVEGPPDGTAPRASGTRSPGDGASVVDLRASSMRVRTTCAAACFLVTSDAPYPGWSAAVDGSPAAIHPADEALRGVFLPAGRHDVTFTYAPAAYEIGGAISLASLVAALALAGALHRSRAGAAEPSRRTVPA